MSGIRTRPYDDAPFRHTMNAAGIGDTTEAAVVERRERLARSRDRDFP